MKIEITEKNALAIEAALKKVNGVARSHTVTSFDEVVGIANKLQKSVSELTLADRAGARATYVPAGPWANAYKYSAVSTCIGLQVASDGKRIFLTAVDKCEVHPKAGERFSVTLTEAGYDSYVEHCKARFQRARPAAAALAA